MVIVAPMTYILIKHSLTFQNKTSKVSTCYNIMWAQIERLMCRIHSLCRSYVLRRCDLLGIGFVLSLQAFTQLSPSWAFLFLFHYDFGFCLLNLMHQTLIRGQDGWLHTISMSPIFTTKVPCIGCTQIHFPSFVFTCIPHAPSFWACLRNIYSICELQISGYTKNVQHPLLKFICVIKRRLPEKAKTLN